MISKALQECKSKNIVTSSFFIIPSSLQAQRSDYTYTGREYNREVDQYYYRARTYVSGLGRFTGKDPVGYPGYEYVKNNPMGYVDYYGNKNRDP